MEPMGRMYSGGEPWGTGPRLFGPHGEYLPYSRFDRGWYGTYPQYDRGMPGGLEQQYAAPEHSREHVWRGGLLGWLGSGVRAYASWIGGQMQSWGALLGGTLKGTTEELGRAMRGRGEQMGRAMEQRGDEMMRPSRGRGFEGRPPRSYRRPDDRILDDVHQRVAMAGVDADEVEIEVNNGVVTLTGRVPRRFDKRIIEEIADQVFGVQEVQNQLRLARRIEERATTGEGTALGSNGGESVYRPGGEVRS